jgi:hypothetical protein
MLRDSSRTSLLGRLIAAKPGLELFAILATSLVDRRDACVRAPAQRGENPHPERQGDHDGEQHRDDEWEVTHAHQVGAPEDERCQYDNECKAGQRVGQHVDDEAGSGARLRHGLSLPTARIFTDKEVFCVAYLLLVVVLAGLIYIGWRLTRATSGGPRTRTIGPDDDPDFLRRLGPGDNPRPS